MPGGDGAIGARLYVPRSQVAQADRGGGSPLLVFIHGGGMMYGDLDTHDAPCRFLAERADVRVLSLDYRLAPEHRFPAGVDDCWAAYQWVAEHADDLGADPDRIAVGGDSAGGYLSAVVALKAAEAGVPCRFQLLVYPMTNMAEPSESRRMFGRGFYLTDEFIDLANESYLADVRGRCATRWCRWRSPRRSPRTSPRRTSPPPASTRSATRVRRGRAGWPTAASTSRSSASRG